MFFCYYSMAASQPDEAWDPRDHTPPSTSVQLDTRATDRHGRERKRKAIRQKGRSSKDKRERKQDRPTAASALGEHLRGDLFLPSEAVSVQTYRGTF